MASRCQKYDERLSAADGRSHTLTLCLLSLTRHDKIRKAAKNSEKEGCKCLIKNGRYFVAPQKNFENFKQLFARLAAQGAGRPADRSGLPDGPWTPDTLAEAISSIDANREGIDLRTVQIWFQDNDNGINSANIRWLARIFGCGDADATSQWQVELRAAKDRLADERRTKRKVVLAAPEQTPDDREGPSILPSAQPVRPNATNPTDSLGGVVVRSGEINLAARTEAMFTGPNSLNLPIVLWGSLGVLWFLAVSLGIESVTYSPSIGITKQVGFIWNPAWNLGEAIFIPIFLMMVSGLLNSWKNKDRKALLDAGEAHAVDPWASKIKSFWLSYWGIFFICFIVIFLLQWAGVYLFPLLENDPNVTMIDWLLISLVRPDILSTNAAIVVSLLGFLYSGMVYWFFFTGLLLLYTLAGDFADICRHRQGGDEKVFRTVAFASGTKIMQRILRCAILGILVAICIKLNAAYLISNSENVTGWLIHDASLAFGFRDDEWGWINGSPSPFFTSFLLLFLVCFVFGACLMLVKSALDRTVQTPREKRYLQLLWFRMTLIVVALAAGYMLVGQFFGFSIVLVGSFVISLVALLWQPRPFNNIIHRT